MVYPWRKTARCSAAATQPRKPRTAGFARPSLELLEDRCTPAITFQFDYSLDTSGFFNNPQARAALQQAGQIIGSQLNDQLSAITPNGSNNWTAILYHPSNGSIVRIDNLSIAADTIVIYVGAEHFGGTTLGVGGPGGASARGGSAWYNTVMTRGQTGASSSSPNDFGPWGGSITFDASSNWYFGGTSGMPSAGQYDFLSVAMHEIGHLLGVGTAQSWASLVSGERFYGTHSMSVYAGAVPVDPGGGHWASGVRFNGTPAAMAPSIPAGARRMFTALDWAALRDIGWNSSPPPQAPTNTITYTGTNTATSETIGVFSNDTRTFALRNTTTGGTADAGEFTVGSNWVALAGDWNNDGRDDIGFFDPSTATWYLRTVQAVGNDSVQVFQYGGAGWHPVVGDWNGDGRTDIGVVDRSSMTWYLKTGVGGGGANAGVFQFGGGGWQPVVGDWNGDGRTDIGAVELNSMTWYLKHGIGGGVADAGSFQFGWAGAVPVVGDWNGNGRSGIGVYDRNAGLWYLRHGRSGGPAAMIVQFGGTGRDAIVGDWNGDGQDDLGFYRSRNARWMFRSPDGSQSRLEFGPAAWTPLAGDWNGDGRATIGFFDPGTATWMLQNNNNRWQPQIVFQYGAPGWTPVVGDWNGDGQDGIGVVSGDNTWYLRQTSNGGAADAGTFSFGPAGTIPVTGDWNGNNRSGIGAYDPTSGTWYLRNAASGGSADSIFAFGPTGGIPVTGDWDGNGTTTVGVFLSSSATWYLRNSNNPGNTDYAPFVFGQPNSRPVVGNWSGSQFALTVEGEIPLPAPCNCSLCRAARTAQISAPEPAVSAPLEVMLVRPSTPATGDSKEPGRLATVNSFLDRNDLEGQGIESGAEPAEDPQMELPRTRPSAVATSALDAAFASWDGI